MKHTDLKQFLALQHALTGERERVQARLAKKGVLPNDYARPALDKHRPGKLGTTFLGDIGGRTKDILGRVHKCYLPRLARAEEKNGGQFSTLFCVVRLLEEMLGLCSLGWRWRLDLSRRVVEIC